MRYLKLATASPAPPSPTAPPTGAPAPAAPQGGAAGRWVAPAPKVPQAVSPGHVDYTGQPLPLVSGERPVAHNGQFLQPHVVAQQQAVEAEAAKEAGKDTTKADADVKIKEMQEKAKSDVYKAQVNHLSSALKLATSPVFVQDGRVAGEAPGLRSPLPPQGNLFDAKKHPVLAGIYNFARSSLLAPLLNRTVYGGIQGNLMDRAWHPLVQNQLEAGPDRYQPGMWDMINRSGLTGLVGSATKYLGGLAGGGGANG